MILHIFNNQKKFSKGYFKFLVDNGFDLTDMKLIHYGKKDDFFKEEVKLSHYFIRSYASIFGNLRMLIDLFHADKIVVHSLAAPSLLFYLTIFPWFQKKVIWIIWGKDLYFYKIIKEKKIFHKIYEWFRKKSIRNIGTIVTSIQEDYDILKQYYKVTGKYIECNVLYFYSFDNTIGRIKECPAKKTVLLGNSGSVSNNHKEAIELLSRNIQDIKKVYCPLSYGGTKKYRQEIIAYGSQLLGDKFIPLTHFVPLEKYKQILGEIDIGFFNHNRQEGLANIWMLMFMGKTIYLKRDISSAKYFNRVGIKVRHIENIRSEGLKCVQYSDLEENQKRLSEIMSAENSIRSWKQILEIQNCRKEK